MSANGQPAVLPADRLFQSWKEQVLDIVNSQTAAEEFFVSEKDVIEPEQASAGTTGVKHNTFVTVVRRIEKQGRDCVLIGLGLQEPQESVYSYKHGQYVVMHINIQGIDYRRSYSLCSTPADKELMIAVKRIPGGVVSNYVNDQLKVGDTLRISKAEGGFFVQPEAFVKRKVTFIAAGSGISPLYSMIKGLLAVEHETQIELLYSNQHEESVIFHDELKFLCREYPGQLRVDNFYTQMPQLSLWHKLISRIRSPKGWYIHKGRIGTKALTRNVADDLYGSAGVAHEYYICGPQAMIDEACATLKEAGVSGNSIHFEYFYADAQAQGKAGGGVDHEQTRKLLSQVKQQQVTIINQGIRSTFAVYPDETILDAAEREGLDPPYSCRSAVCSSCTGRLVSGRVVMSMNNVLSDEEIADGKIITCQTHPLTDDVVIEYGE